MARRSDAVSIVLILVLGVVLRLPFALASPVLLAGDSPDYFEPASALLRSGGFPLPLRRGPAYSIVIVLTQLAVGERLENLVALNHAFGVGTALLTYGIGRLMFGRLAGFLAGIATAISGELLLREQYIMAESLITFLLALTVFLAVVGLRRGSLRWFFAAGLVLGLAALTRPAALFISAGLVPVAIAALYRRSSLWRAAGVAILGSLLATVPWVVRNQAVHGTSAIAASGTVILAKLRVVPEFDFIDPDGPDRDADPQRQAVRRTMQDLTERTADGGWPSIGKTAAWLMKEWGLSEAAVDTMYREISLEAIRRHPLVYLREVVVSFWGLMIGDVEPLRQQWRGRDRNRGVEGGALARLLQPISREQQAQFPLAESLFNLYLSPRLQPLLLLPALVGAVASAAIPAWRAGLVPVFLILSLQGLTALVSGANPRYYSPIEPHIHLLAAGGVVLVLSRLKARWAARDPAAQAAASGP